MRTGAALAAMVPLINVEKDNRTAPPRSDTNPRRFIRSPRRRGRAASERTYSTLNALFFETLDKRDHVALFGLRHLELRQGRGGMTEEHGPVAIADAHASVGEHHVPASIVHRSARARAQEIDEELLLAHDAVFSAMRPEAPELRIGPKPGQKI